MKIFLLFLSICTFVSATEIHFQIDPYSGAILNTTPGKEHVRLFDGGKFGETVLLASKLKNTGKNQLSSPGGTVFTFQKLAKPEVKAPGLRHEFTATWRVTLSGKGKEWEKIFETLGHAKDSKNPKTILIYGYETSK